MATTTSLTNAFREGLLKGVFDFDAGVMDFYMALYNLTGTHNQNTAAYTTVEEVPTSGGYTALGLDMGDFTQTDDSTFHVSWLDTNTNPSWATSTITATGCMIYRSGGTVPSANASVYVGDFSGPKSSSGGAFSVILPSPAYTTALIRLA